PEFDTKVTLRANLLCTAIASFRWATGSPFIVQVTFRYVTVTHFIPAAGKCLTNRAACPKELKNYGDEEGIHLSSSTGDFRDLRLREIKISDGDLLRQHERCSIPAQSSRGRNGGSPNGTACAREGLKQGREGFWEAHGGRSFQGE